MTSGEISQHIRSVQDRYRKVGEMVKKIRVPYYRRGEMAIPAFKMNTGGNPKTDGYETSVKLVKKVVSVPVDLFLRPGRCNT